MKPHIQRDVGLFLCLSFRQLAPAGRNSPGLFACPKGERQCGCGDRPCDSSEVRNLLISKKADLHLFEIQEEEMKTIRYEFITEEIVEIEISDEWGEKLKSVKREQWKLDKREERHSVNFADLDGKEEYFADSKDDPFAMIEEERYRDYKADHERRIVKAFSELSVSQRELLKALYEDGMTETEYASKLGISQAAVARRLNRIKRKLEKLLK